jgi:hypothetical protein
VIKNLKPFFTAIQKFTTVGIIFKESKSSSFIFSLTDVNVENSCDNENGFQASRTFSF